MPRMPIARTTSLGRRPGGHPEAIGPGEESCQGFIDTAKTLQCDTARLDSAKRAG
jgi:hypothetical protein